ncbi:MULTISPECIES: RagB/SusD family nutrient uptake outer membrane protein [unclassified Polaribacter]|uniref:RagB/SusD family nutrient uptake outer membrane protein n=1 Tax=unclassified Polaribacter TaxID=196858 RepID=UPI0011BF2EEF|nr:MULTISPECIES: RagB/SusD family nutrient uptake outer membrane protein [unclassified Polaribacter]TXD54298.1 RagB/SusD family nutrient uptake outer membrane protein [Polaribacter sp. IC063]TXD62871.1 RagB/SusD family nutrient uptake outer membrane protein [Polaribacter sp. IC066]
MKAETLIFSGQVENGLTIIDGVRTQQQASLASAASKGLTQTQALEELRIERRIGLFLRGVSFYDARRWDITKTPKSR